MDPGLHHLYIATREITAALKRYAGRDHYFGNRRTVTNTRPVVVVRTIEELRALRQRRVPSEFTLVIHLAELTASLGQAVNWPKSIRDDPGARNYGTGTGSAGNGTVERTESAVTRRTTLAELRGEPSTNHIEDTSSLSTPRPS